ncbi:MAG: RnfABCDGE type electron transport complex subunit D [Gammaproteobacteria bacterium]
MDRFMAWLRARTAPGEGPTIGNSIVELFDRFLYGGDARTIGAPHVRDSISTHKLLNTFVIASLPCWLLGMWNVGEQINLAMEIMGQEAALGWRGDFIALLGVGYDPDSLGANLFHGFLYFMPDFAIALATGAFLEALFAKYRQKPVGEGLLAIAWFYTLMLPATASPALVMIGMAFGLVVGKLLFGGAGRYVVNPAVLGIAFLVFSYSAILFGYGAWIPVPGYDEPTTVELALDEGGVPALLSVNYTWKLLFLGNQPGPMGVPSILGCIIGAAYLLYRGVASWRIMLGSFIGMVGTALLFNAFGPADDPNFAVPWYWHMVIGGWAFGTVFMATDPVAAASTNPGRWVFGLFVGALTIIVRVTNPSYYDGTLFAILLASVFAPLFDYVVVQRNIKRRLNRQAESP